MSACGEVVLSVLPGLGPQGHLPESQEESVSHKPMNFVFFFEGKKNKKKLFFSVALGDK